jgi:hypothetical protein
MEFAGIESQRLDLKTLDKTLQPTVSSKFKNKPQL